MSFKSNLIALYYFHSVWKRISNKQKTRNIKGDSHVNHIGMA